MSEPEPPKQQPDNPLPDPSGRPLKAATTLAPAFDVAATITGTVLGCGAVMLLLIGNMATATAGARRSSQLKWQEQQRQADDARSQDVADQDAMSQDVMKKDKAEHPEQPQHE